MNILIAGGSGFIGSALTQTLIRNGHQVNILTRRKNGLENPINAQIKFTHWDGETLGDWVRAVNDSQVVVNLAGENIGGKNILEVLTKRWTKKRKELLRSSRINTGRLLTQAIQSVNNRPKTFIQASAVGYYGSHPHLEFTEQSPPGNDFLAKLCVEWENSSAEVESLGVRRVVMRIAGIVMAADGGSLPFLLLPYKFYAGGPLGSGSQWVSWIHLQDLVRGILLFIERDDTNGAYNLCAPQTITNREMSQIIGKVLNRPSFLPIPQFFFKIAFGEKADALLASQKQIPQRLLAAGFQYLFPDFESALRDILRK